MSRKVSLYESSKGFWPGWGCLFTWKLREIVETLWAARAEHIVWPTMLSVDAPLAPGLPLALQVEKKKKTMRGLLRDVLTYRRIIFSWKIIVGQYDSISASLAAEAWNKSTDKNQFLTSQYLFFSIGYKLPDFLAGNASLHTLKPHMCVNLMPPSWGRRGNESHQRTSLILPGVTPYSSQPWIKSALRPHRL